MISYLRICDNMSPCSEIKMVMETHVDETECWVSAPSRLVTNVSPGIERKGLAGPGIYTLGLRHGQT